MNAILRGLLVRWRQADEAKAQRRGAREARALMGLECPNCGPTLLALAPTFKVCRNITTCAYEWHAADKQMAASLKAVSKTMGGAGIDAADHAKALRSAFQ